MRSTQILTSRARAQPSGENCKSAESVFFKIYKKSKFNNAPYLPEEFLHDKKKTETITKINTYTIVPAAIENETPVIPRSP